MARKKHHLDATKILTPEQIDGLADRAVEAAETYRGTMSGAERHALAVDDLIDQLDRALKWGNTPVGLLLEAIDGPAIHLLWSLAGATTQRAFDRWQAKK